MHSLKANEGRLEETEEEVKEDSCGEGVAITNSLGWL